MATEVVDPAPAQDGCATADAAALLCLTAPNLAR